jgi:hypothetical protein
MQHFYLRMLESLQSSVPWEKYISFCYYYLIVQTSNKNYLNNKCILFFKDNVIFCDPVANNCIVFVPTSKVHAGCSHVTDPFALFGVPLYMKLQYTELSTILDYNLINNFISNSDIHIVLH